jgi:hypothetical protein
MRKFYPPDIIRNTQQSAFVSSKTNGLSDFHTFSDEDFFWCMHCKTKLVLCPTKGIYSCDCGKSRFETVLKLVFIYDPKTGEIDSNLDETIYL